jgi:hypothetical protein
MSVLGTFLAAVTFAAGSGAGPSSPVNGMYAANPVMQHASILLVEIADAKASPWSQATPQMRTVTVRFRASRVLKDADGLGLAAGEFTADVPQSRWPAGRIGDNPYAWSYIDIEPGQRYLVFSDLKENDPSAMFTAPDLLEGVSGDADIVADVELILAAASGSTAQQARAVAAVLRRAGSPRSHLLAHYAASLLASGAEADTATLAEAVQATENLPFSKEGRRSFLFQLFQFARTVDDPQGGLVRAFVEELLRAFLVEARVADSGLTGTQINILQNYVPWLQSSERARSVLREQVPGPLKDRVRANLAGRAGSGQVPAAYRGSIQQLLKLIG